MSDIKFIVLCKVLADIAIILSVTYLAREFENSSLMWWYLLCLFTGYTFKKNS